MALPHGTEMAPFNSTNQNRTISCEMALKLNSTNNLAQTVNTGSMCCMWTVLNTITTKYTNLRQNIITSGASHIAPCIYNMDHDYNNIRSLVTIVINIIREDKVSLYNNI